MHLCTYVLHVYCIFYVNMSKILCSHRHREQTYGHGWEEERVRYIESNIEICITSGKLESQGEFAI